MTQLFQTAEYTRHAVHALHHLRLLNHSRQLVKGLPIPQCGSMIRSAWNEAGQFPANCSQRAKTYWNVPFLIMSRIWLCTFEDT